MHPDHRPRRGIALLDVLVSVVLLASAGTALLAMLGQTRRTMTSVQSTERAIDSAAAELDRLSVLDRDALLALEGRTRHGAFAINVQRITPALFDVAVLDDRGVAQVTTTVYRPDSSHAP
jgi:type II secretory pathway component PulJ